MYECRLFLKRMIGNSMFTLVLFIATIEVAKSNSSTSFQFGVVILFWLGVGLHFGCAVHRFRSYLDHIERLCIRIDKKFECSNKESQNVS